MIITNEHGVSINDATATLKCGEQTVKITNLHDNGAVSILINGKELYVEWDGKKLIYVHYDGEEWHNENEER